jgi:hypothetical protein
VKPSHHKVNADITEQIGIAVTYSSTDCLQNGMALAYQELGRTPNRLAPKPWELRQCRPEEMWFERQVAGQIERKGNRVF